MKNDFEIDIFDETSIEDSAAQLPMNFLLFGEVENDDAKVYIKQDVYKALEKYSLADTTKERGTILIGTYTEDLGKTHVVISDYIEAKYTDASAATLTFTHETWDYVHAQHDKLYSDKKIIGWQHTHPNYGIFLSNYDIFIQENFFNLPFQIAYVIDPIQNLRGFFQWKNGKIEKLRGYYVYDEVGKPIKIEQKQVAKPTAKSKKSAISIVLLALLVVGLSVFGGIKAWNYDLQLEIDERLAEENQQQKEIIEQQKQQISVLQQQNQAGAKDEVKFISYTVKKGDTLLEICKAHGLDYYTNKGIILGHNNIEDPKTIYEGQNILLPLS